VVFRPPSKEPPDDGITLFHEADDSCRRWFNGQVLAER
jgi:hypothetical protein